MYRAWHLNLQKYVVVKKIKDHYVGVLNDRGEVDILKSLHHSWLPQVYDFLQIGNEVYTVMEYVEGHDLKYYLDQGCRFDEATLLRWLGQLSDVLCYLHSHGILHLDIKPANIMVTPENNICLIDFNISLSGGGDSLTGISEIYASPEQYRKFLAVLYGTPDREGALDARTDIYSLGATLYHLMTGYLPSARREGMIPLERFALPYSKELVRIVARMLAPEKRRRYRDAEALRRALERMQRSRAEKRTLGAVFLAMLAGIAVITVACGVLFYRNTQYVSAETRSAIQAMETELDRLCQEGDYVTAYQEGVAFLNQEEQSIGRLSGARQSILEQLLEACVGMEEYNLADTYLQELLTLEEKAEYYQDAAIIAAWQGDFSEAEACLVRAQELGGDSTALTMSRAELYMAQGLYGEALELYQGLNQTDTVALRRMALLALKAAQSDSAYAEAAAGYYEQLLSSGKASYTDRMNLSTAYTLLGLYEKAISTLKALSAEYPEEYGVFLELAVLEYNAQIRKPLASRDLTAAARYAQRAKTLYESGGNTEVNERLAEILELTGAE